MREAVIALILWGILVITPLSELLERTLLGHVLVEFPLLIGVGVALGRGVAHHTQSGFNVINRGGIPGILIASFATAFWMIPRWLDASLTDPNVALLKYVTFPLCIGFLLAVSWPRLPPLARGVVKIELLSMLFRVGWLYLISPERLCSNYLLSEQEKLGKAFLIIASGLTLIWGLNAFFRDARETPNQQRLLSNSG